MSDRTNDPQGLDSLDYATLETLATDFPVYAEECLEIKTKSEGKMKLVLNFVQLILLAAFYKMLEERGFVRYIIVKGRQQTCSTLVTGLFFHIAQHEPATDVYIMSHEVKSTSKLFEKISIFNECMQREHPMLSFGTEVENRQEFKFTNGSTYGVGTAGEGNTGRGITAKLFHGSEPAFWGNSEQIKAGALQTVALNKGTWVVLESTANGINWFYDFAAKARKGIGVYRLIFIPWVWTPEYALEITKDESPFVRTKEEVKVAETLLNVHSWTVTDEQLNWRRAKIEEMGPRTFKQEYPNTFEEAFQFSTASFYDMDRIYKAMNTPSIETYGARVAGLDLGRDRAKNPNGNPDRTVMVFRRGRSIYKKLVWDEMNSPRMAGILADMVDKDEFDHCFMDYALGGPVYDLLCERGYGRWFTCVDFGESPIDDQYGNKRAEIHCLFEEWLKDGECSIINDLSLAADISMMPYWELNSNSRKLFPEKKKLRELYGRSPDELDALVLTFSFPVSADINEHNRVKHTANTRNGSALTAQRQLRKLASQEANSYTNYGQAPKQGSRAPGRRFVGD